MAPPKLEAFLTRLAAKAAARDGAGGSSSSVYGSRAYWEQRYGDGAVVGGGAAKGELSNEWLVGFAPLRATLVAHAPRDEPTLVIGTGLSLLAEDMAEDGWERVTAVDYAKACVATMASRDAARLADDDDAHPVAFAEMDVTRLALADGCVAAVVDKATVDSLFNTCGDAESAAVEGSAVRLCLLESCRVLRPGGAFVCVSYGEPEDRLPFLTAAELAWDLVEQRELKKGNATFYVYVLRRRDATTGA